MQENADMTVRAACCHCCWYGLSTHVEVCHLSLQTSEAVLSFLLVGPTIKLTLHTRGHLATFGAVQTREVAIQVAIQVAKRELCMRNISFVF
jgi:hypothetical protein